jgi:hypothetical protein
MTILAAEVKFYHPEERSDVSTNGGRMTATESVSNTSGNLFPDVPQAERIAGSEKFRKLFLKIASAGDETLYNTLLFANQTTPGDDLVTMFLATSGATDTQDDITGTEDHFGTGKLNASATAGATSITVLVEDDSIDRIFREDDVIRITDKQTLEDSGNEEFFTVDSLSYVGNVATIGLSDPLANNYSNTDTYVGSGLSLGDIVGEYDTFVVTSGAGDYNDVTNPIVVNSIGGVEQDWTLTFTSATNFNIVGDTLGSVGSGTVGAGASPSNPDFSEPYFTLASGGFSGTFATSDTITFTTHAAARGVWFKRTVPAGADAIASNTLELIVNGENV